MNRTHYYSSLPTVHADDAEIERYAVLLDSLGIGLIVYSTDADPVLCNTVASRLLGEKPAVWRDRNGQEMPLDQWPEIQALRTEQPVFESIITIDNKDATPIDRIWLSVNALPVFSSESRLRRVLLTLNDITDLRQLQHEIGRLTTHDHLTGSFNKDVIEHLLETEIRRAQRYGTPFTISMIDIDHFLPLCEKHGRVNGDLVLTELGKLLGESLREIDMVGRIGNDEFLLVLPNVRITDAIIVMERLRATIEERLFTPDSLRITISGGITEYAGEASPLLLERCSVLLVNARESGRNRLCLDPDSLH